MVSSVPDSEPADEVGASLAPVTVRVTVTVSVPPLPSAAVTSRVSVTTSPPSNASMSASLSSGV